MSALFDVGPTQEERDEAGALRLRTRVGPWLISSVQLGHPFVAALDEILDPILGREAGKWETMVFAPELTDYTDYDCLRAASEAAARVNHEILCAKWAAIEPSAAQEAVTRRYAEAARRLLGAEKKNGRA